MTQNANMPLGTYVQDGLRSGPFYTNRTTSYSDPNYIANGVFNSGSYDNYGPGMLYSPIQTYDITPLQANPAGGFTVLNNVVASGTAPAGAGNLTLRADGYVTTAIINPDGSQGLQFDWPRVVTVTVAGAALTNPVQVTIFGFDYYKNPLQHTYTVQATGTYPNISGAPLILSVPSKAFFGVTRVYVNAAVLAGTISLGASEIFGLPFVVPSFANVINIGFGVPAALTGDLTVTAVGGSNIARGMFEPADLTSPATATTGDVRGLYCPFSIANGTPTNGLKSLVFSSYVRGANTFINQLNSMQWPQYNAVTTAPGIVPPLAPLDLYGVPQYYTGNP